MLINKYWSAPKKVAYGKNITIQYSKSGFSFKVFNENGIHYERQVQEGRRTEIRAADIMNILHPMIALKSDTEPEIHVHVERPMF